MQSCKQHKKLKYSICQFINMKKNSRVVLIVFLLLWSGLSASAQKYKVKDGVITKDDVVLGTVTGKSGLVNANVIIYGIGGEKVISFYRDEYKAPSPLFEDRYWYNVRFEDTGKEMFLPMAVEFSVKSVLNKTFPAAGINIDGALIKNQDEIMAKSDIKDSILSDTTFMGASHRHTLDLIRNTFLVERKRDVKCGFEYLSSEKRNDTTFTKWEISQDSKRIGTFLERKNYLYSKDNYTYIIYRYILDNGSDKEVPIAMGKPDALDVNIIHLYTIIDKKDVKITVSPAISADMVNDLIKGRYL